MKKSSDLVSLTLLAQQMGLYNPLPWWTLPAIYFLNKKLSSVDDLTVFEYGSGMSTLWLENFSLSVFSIEHDPEWYSRIKKQIRRPEVNIYKIDNKEDEYANSIDKFNKDIDLVIIDGLHRCSSFYKSIENEVPLILLDDNDRPEYKECNDHATICGYKHIDFAGPAFGSSNFNLTTLYYKNENKFEL